MAIITQLQAIANANKVGGMTVQDWHDLIDSVQFEGSPEYSRNFYHDFVTAHNGLFGETFASFMRSVTTDEDPIIDKAYAGWGHTCLNRQRQWIMALRSMGFGGGGGVPLDGIFTVPFVTQFV